MSAPDPMPPGRPRTTAEGFAPLYARIQAYIRSGIASGQFRPGSRLPSENELASLFATTRATVAHALQKLVFDGLVVRRAGSGTYVKEAAQPSAESGLAGSLDEPSGTPEEVVGYKLLSFATVAASQRGATGLDLPGGADAFRMERLHLAGGRPLGFECSFIPHHIGVRMTMAMLQHHSMQDALAELGVPVARVEGVIRAGLAAGRIATHLQVPRGSALLIRDYRLVDHMDQLLVQGETSYRHDHRLYYDIRGESGASGPGPNPPSGRP